MTPEQMDELMTIVGRVNRSKIAACAETISGLSGDVASDTEVMARGALHELLNGVFGAPTSPELDDPTPPIRHRTAEERFDKFCECTLQAFPDQSPTDVQILSNSATPDLIRYLLLAMRRCPVEDIGADSRIRKVAKAFRFTGGRGKAGLLGELDAPARLAASNAFSAAMGKSLRAWRASRDDAYWDAYWIEHLEGISLSYSDTEEGRDKDRRNAAAIDATPDDEQTRAKTIAMNKAVDAAYVSHRYRGGRDSKVTKKDIRSLLEQATEGGW